MKRLIIILIVISCCFACLPTTNQRVYNETFSKGVELLNSQEFSSAIPYLQKAYEMFDKLSSNAGKTNQPAFGLQLCYEELGDYEKALKYGNVYSASIKKALGTTHKDYLDNLSKILFYNLKLQDYEAALDTGVEWRSLAAKLYGENSKDYAEVMSTIGIVYQNLASYYSSEQDYENAKQNGEKALKIIEQYQGKDNLSYAIILDNLGKYYNNLGYNERAYHISLEVVELFKKLTGENSIDYMMALEHLAEHTANVGKIDDAIELCERAMNLAKRLGETPNKYYASSADNYASYLRVKGDKERSLQYRLVAYEIWDNLKDDYLLDWLISSNNVIINYVTDFEDYDKAVEYGEKVLNHPKLNSFRHLPVSQYIFVQMRDIYTALGEPEKSRGVGKYIVGN